MSHTLLALLLVLLSAASASASDGVVEINAARAAAGGVTPSDAPGLPVTLDASGSYLLTGNLLSSGANETIIEITADDVTLDLNGFTIRCSYFITPCAGTGNGIGIKVSTSENVTVRNGVVRDMPLHGIRLETYATVENVRSLSNGGDGIKVGKASIVRGSVALENGGFGFRIGGGTLLEGNVSYSNLEGVRYTGRGVLIRGNTIRANTDFAIQASFVPSHGAYVGNSIMGNNGTSELIDGDQGIAATAIGTNLCGIDTSCP